MAFIWFINQDLAHKDEKVRKATVWSIGANEDLKNDLRIVELLIRMRDDTSEGVRLEAARVLGEIGNSALGEIKRAVEYLIYALNDRDKDVRRNAEEALGKIKQEVESLQKLLKDTLRGGV
jgi:HEAT repeat protein